MADEDQDSAKQDGERADETSRNAQSNQSQPNQKPGVWMNDPEEEQTDRPIHSKPSIVLATADNTTFVLDDGNTNDKGSSGGSEESDKYTTKKGKTASHGSSKAPGPGEEDSSGKKGNKASLGHQRRPSDSGKVSSGISASQRRSIDASKSQAKRGSTPGKSSAVDQKRKTRVQQSSPSDEKERKPSVLNKVNQPGVSIAIHQSAPTHRERRTSNASDGSNQQAGLATVDERKASTNSPVHRGGGSSSQRLTSGQGLGVVQKSSSRLNITVGSSLDKDRKGSSTSISSSANRKSGITTVQTPDQLPIERFQRTRRALSLSMEAGYMRSTKTSRIKEVPGVIHKKYPDRIRSKVVVEDCDDKSTDEEDCPHEEGGLASSILEFLQKFKGQLPVPELDGDSEGSVDSEDCTNIDEEVGKNEDEGKDSKKVTFDKADQSSVITSGPDNDSVFDLENNDERQDMYEYNKDSGSIKGNKDDKGSNDSGSLGGNSGRSFNDSGSLGGNNGRHFNDYGLSGGQKDVDDSAYGKYINDFGSSGGKGHNYGKLITDFGDQQSVKLPVYVAAEDNNNKVPVNSLADALYLTDADLDKWYRELLYAVFRVVHPLWQKYQMRLDPWRLCERMLDDLISAAMEDPDGELFKALACTLDGRSLDLAIKDIFLQWMMEKEDELMDVCVCHCFCCGSFLGFSETVCPSTNMPSIVSIERSKCPMSQDLDCCKTQLARLPCSHYAVSSPKNHSQSCYREHSKVILRQLIEKYRTAPPGVTGPSLKDYNCSTSAFFTNNISPCQPYELKELARACSSKSFPQNPCFMMTKFPELYSSKISPCQPRGGAVPYSSIGAVPCSRAGAVPCSDKNNFLSDPCSTARMGPNFYSQKYHDCMAKTR